MGKPIVMVRNGKGVALDPDAILQDVLPLPVPLSPHYEGIDGNQELNGAA